MTYSETLDFLFNRLQSFHNQGAKAYKPGLEKAFRLSAAFGNPHESFRSIHVGGTNGKGSTSHCLASVLQSSGMKVGLYTSPHLIDFNERIRINGKPISHTEIIEFIDRFVSMNLTETDPSFFELTTIMAFDHFARHQVDVAVVEVGLGGRLDTTNIILPEISVITNISFDHTAQLGHTLEAIATEKSGIIKDGVPVVIGRRNPETDSVFLSKATDVVFAEDQPLYHSYEANENAITYFGTPWGKITCELNGDCQPENMRTILRSLKILEDNYFVKLTPDVVDQGLQKVCCQTGLMGRWMKVSEKPEVITDTAHNVDGWQLISKRLRKHLPKPLHIVIGFVNDKDYNTILSMLPAEATYYFVQPGVKRAASSANVAKEGARYGLQGSFYSNVMDGYEKALNLAADQEDALIYVGGSTFVVADLLSHL